MLLQCLHDVAAEEFAPTALGREMSFQGVVVFDPDGQTAHEEDIEQGDQTVVPGDHAGGFAIHGYAALILILRADGQIIDRPLSFFF